MRYFPDMTTKWGFSDGEAIPQGIEKYRRVYVLALNRLLQKHKSCLRVAAWDRGGVHNWCLILTVPEALVRNVKEADLADPVKVGKLDVPGTEHRGDDAFSKAFEEARDADLDQYVLVETKVHSSFNAYLKGI